MSESTIERVARAICEAEYGEGATIDTVHVRQARAAIEAMRELTPEMDMAGQRGRYQRYGGVRTMWIAMIDEALRGDDGHAGDEG